MRFIASFSEERQIRDFSSFLKKEGIDYRQESSFDPASQRWEQRFWIVEENHFEKALHLLEELKKHPSIAFSHSSLPEMPSDHFSHLETVPVKKKYLPYALTYFFLFLCVGLFFWSAAERQVQIDQYGRVFAGLSLIPLQKTLFFDYPKAFDNIQQEIERFPWHKETQESQVMTQIKGWSEELSQAPYWKGFLDTNLKEKPPLFEKIRSGEIWRLFTPALLHQDLLHILFNMAWLWVLGKQIEQRLPRWKMLLALLFIGIVSNLAQYLVSGPFFLGFSGIVMGMIGFIWARERVAPWEGYPLNKTVFLFVFLFLVALIVLELGSIFAHFFWASQMRLQIGNTAHIVGGLTGIGLGYLPFFSRGH
jgi:GlpG protein